MSSLKIQQSGNTNYLNLHGEIKMNEPTSQQNQAAEPRRDEREEALLDGAINIIAFLKSCVLSGEDLGPNYEEQVDKFLEKLRASRASAALPQPANEILQTLKFAKEVIDDQVARFHEDCRCQLCESLPESLQRAIELLESSKIAAVPQPSASAAPLSQNVRKLWIVEWKFTGVGGDWKSIHSEPFETEAAALTYPKRQGFEYRVVEYSASQPQPSAGQTEGK